MNDYLAKPVRLGGFEGLGGGGGVGWDYTGGK
jgi:hypothetical protein